MAANDEYMVADGTAWELIVADAELRKIINRFQQKVSVSKEEVVRRAANCSMGISTCFCER